MNSIANKPRFTFMQPRLAGRTFAPWLWVVLAFFLSVSGLAHGADTAEVTASIRAHTESQFKATTGLGFVSFDCAYPNGWPGSREILCDATDEEGDQFIYRLYFEADQREPRSSMMQPVEQLNPEGLAVLSQPSNAFMQAFARSNWNAAFDVLSPPLQQQLGRQGLRDILEPMKSQFGVVKNPVAVFYASPSEGLHQLNYSFDSDQGKAVGRFRLTIDANNSAQIVGFLVTAEPGSPLHAHLLEQSGKDILARYFDQPIVDVDGSFDQLNYIGDNVQINVVLEDGTSVAARIEQFGTSYDLDTNDFRFQVLDAVTVIGLHLASSEQAASSIDCPASVTPDGGYLDCQVTTADGTTRTLRLMRRGGQHRLAEVDG